MILIFLKIFVEGFLGARYFREQVSEIQFCFKVGSYVSGQSLNQLFESSLSYSSFHSPTPRFIIPQFSFQRRHQQYVCGPLLPSCFLIGVVHSPKAATAPFQLLLGFYVMPGQAGLCHLLATGEAQSLCSA